MGANAVVTLHRSKREQQQYGRACIPWYIQLCVHFCLCHVNARILEVRYQGSVDPLARVLLLQLLLLLLLLLSKLDSRR